MDESVDIAVALLRRDDFEGLQCKPYLCPAGYWTIGYGNRYMTDGTPVTARTAPLTSGQAADLLRESVLKLRVSLRSMVNVPLSPCQEGALLSWLFNTGITALRRSTLLKCLNRADYIAASKEILRWDKATINKRLVKLPGLTKRRQIECRVFLQDLRAPLITHPEQC